MKRSIWRKTIFILMACLLSFGLVYGVILMGDTPVSAEVSKDMKGSFAGLEDGNKQIKLSAGGSEMTYPLAANVWIYRNLQKASLTDLQRGDQLEVILNSKEQVAYIKASSAAAAPAPVAETTPQAAVPSAAVTAPPAVPAGEAAAAPAPSAGASAQAGTPSATTKAPAAGTAAAAQAGTTSEWPWEELELELKNRELQLKIKQKVDAAKLETSIYVQTKDRAVINLKGAEAEQLLRLLLSGLPTDRAAWELALKKRLAGEFQLKDASPDWKLEVKWKEGKDVKTPSPVMSKAVENGNGKEQGKGNGNGNGNAYGKDKEKEKDKDKDKDKGKGKGSDKDDDD
jgi:hypothetical protein